MTTTWTESVRNHRATKAEALEAVTEAAARLRGARAETSSARRDLRRLCAAVAESGIAHKTEIAAAGGFSGSSLYLNNPLPDREVTP